MRKRLNSYVNPRETINEDERSIHLNPWSDAERRKLAKEVSQEIRATHSSDDIKYYRQVTAKSG